MFERAHNFSEVEFTEVESNTVIFNCWEYILTSQCYPKHSGVAHREQHELLKEVEMALVLICLFNLYVFVEKLSEIFLGSNFPQLHLD